MDDVDPVVELATDPHADDSGGKVAAIEDPICERGEGVSEADDT